MKIKKGDILYRYDAIAISDKDYCTDEYNANNKRRCMDQDGEKCKNYNKCNYPPLKSELEKVRITKLEKNFHDGEVYMYRYVLLKYEDYKPRGTIFASNVNRWSKTKSASLRKHNSDLKKYIIKSKKLKPGDIWYCDQDEIKTYKSLQKRVQKKVDNLKPDSQKKI